MGGKTFMLMAGGTGGHIFPALAVADSLRVRGHHVIWLGSKDSMEERIVPQYGIRLETLAIKGIRGNGIKRKLMLPFTLYKPSAKRSGLSANTVSSASSASAVLLPFPAVWRRNSWACRL
ncbi:undecaprenyldiphospho-muramoylpentapeptide beta-N-acetylglucosaminyltransferase [Neisseria gonorrhoeae]|uniref:Undecaprenyldiphospho-muramoylpentapeptide beta-N-acetylglucosaminyltransferase n=1 Tax=Neisseria gonorrhoeae TaxID=485 RepID=A0A378VT31_NEIGO|nr:undecaprenyldiphospho-muramoylpentapeptide beta-N-acetylglucosaminyltransferase [Neisseria gonorrhoeae]